jgi:DUF1680 family protein
VSCCPPNLSRTLGLLGGYTWKASFSGSDAVEINVYLFLSAKISLTIPDTGKIVTVEMESSLPNGGEVKWKVNSPLKLYMRVPIPAWCRKTYKAS